jgi:DNA-binding SARP family transcriptional activator
MVAKVTLDRVLQKMRNAVAVTDSRILAERGDVSRVQLVLELKEDIPILVTDHSKEMRGREM